MTDLRICPFCGETKARTNPGRYRTSVHCPVCNAEGPFRDTKEAAAIAWNTRPESRLFRAAEAVLRSFGHYIAVEPETSDYQELVMAVKEAKGDG